MNCIGYVLMPDHFHALLYQPLEGHGISDLMKSFKQHTSGMLGISANLGMTLWKARYDDVPVPRGAAITKLNYLHNNPLRARLVANPEDYPWSSLRDYLEMERGVVTVKFIYG